MARERWTIDGWELTDGVARDVEYRAGQDIASSVAGLDSGVPNRTGAVWGPKHHGPGAFILNVWLAGTDRADAEDQWDLLLRAMTHGHRLLRVQRTRADGEVRECDAQMSGDARPIHLGQLGYRCTLTFTVPSGFWRSEQQYTIASSQGAALPHLLDLTDLEPSTAPMEELSFQVKGAITNPVIVDRTDGVDGDQVTYTGSLTGSQSLTHQSATWDTIGGGGFVPDPAATNPTGSRLLTVPAARPGGTPRVELRGSGGNANTQLIVTGRRSYHC